MSKILLNAYGSIIRDAVNDKKRLNALLLHIEKYFDKNNDIIFGQGPSKRLLFANTDKDVIYTFLNVDPKDVMQVLKTVSTIKASWKLLNDPFIILSVFIIRELTLQKNERARDLVTMYMAMKFYSSRQFTYFKFGANDQIMAFTLNNLTDKYKYKTLKNNYAVVKDIVTNSHNVYEKLLIQGDDDMLNTYFPQMYNRVNKVLRNIANEYYENRDQKKYLNTIKSYDEETGSILDYEDSSGLVESLAEGTTSYFFSSSINMGLVRNVAERNSIPYVQVYQTLTAMRKDEDPKDINRLIASIVATIYEADNSLLARVCSTDFAVSAIKQLSVSNSSSKSLAIVKKELDRVLDAYCSKYAMTQRLATKMSYRNAIYSYIVYILITNRCK